MIVVVALGRRALTGTRSPAGSCESPHSLAEHLAEAVMKVAERHDLVLTIADDPEPRNPDQPNEHDAWHMGECLDQTNVSAPTYLATTLEQQLRRRLPDRMITTVLTQIAAIRQLLVAGSIVIAEAADPASVLVPGRDQLRSLPGAVYSDWGTPGMRPVRWATPRAMAQDQWLPRTIGRKTAAACSFVATGSEASPWFG